MKLRWVYERPSGYDSNLGSRRFPACWLGYDERRLARAKITRLGGRLVGSYSFRADHVGIGRRLGEMKRFLEERLG